MFDVHVVSTADQEAAAARSSQPSQALATVRATRPLTGLDRVKENLCRNLRICSCGEGPRPADLTLCFAFPSPGGTFTGMYAPNLILLFPPLPPILTNPLVVCLLPSLSSIITGVGSSSSAASSSASTSTTSPVWLLHKIHRDESRLCALSNTYLLSCYRTQGNAAASTGSHAQPPRVLDDNGLVLLKFAESAELSITRACSGYLLLQVTDSSTLSFLLMSLSLVLMLLRVAFSLTSLQERSFVSGQGPQGLLRSTSSCQGMKLRCGARGVSLGGFALRHSYGAFVTEVEGNLIGAETKFRRHVGPISSIQGMKASTLQLIGGLLTYYNALEV